MIPVEEVVTCTFNTINAVGASLSAIVPMIFRRNDVAMSLDLGLDRQIDLLATDINGGGDDEWDEASAGLNTTTSTRRLHERGVERSPLLARRVLHAVDGALAHRLRDEPAAVAQAGHAAALRARRAFASAGPGEGQGRRLGGGLLRRVRG